MTVTVHHGDCREVLATLPAESVHACVTDPPYGLTFMGKKWDSIDGAAFQPETWAAVLRVMKPGAHLVAFGGTRGFHRMFCAIEDAGFEVRDCFLDLFAGAPAFAAFFDSLTTAQRHAFEEMAALHSFLGALAWAYGSGFPKSHNVGDGWGTALKPAWEPICLARKPFKGTVAANVAAHGTGALNVDGCRIAFASEEDQAAAAAAAQRVCHDAPGQVMKGLGETGFKNPRASLAPYLAKMDKGRWPANVIHDGSEEVLEAFAVYGESKTPNTVTRGSSDSKHGSSNRSGQIQSFPCHGDSGSAARFFKSTPATVEDIAWMTEPVNFAVECSSLQSEAAVSVLANAVAVSMPGSALLQPSYRAPSTSATASEFALLCEIVTATIQSIARRCSHGSPPQSITASVGPATCAATHERTDTMTITASHWRSDGSADPVTFNITLPSAGLGAKVSASRFHYSSKADASDRLGSKHPTIKPVDLMRWLVRLVTPPGGLVLDPFAGSGTTGMAAAMEGMRAVLIEREAEYVADINRRLAHMRGADAPLFTEVA